MFFLFEITKTSYAIIILVKTYINVFKTVMRIAPGRRLQVFQLILSYTISNIIKLLPPLATAGIISVVTRASNFNAIWFYVILFILFTILYYSVNSWSYYLETGLVRYYYSTTQHLLFNHIAKNPLILESISKGRITDTFTEDVSYMYSTVRSGVYALTSFFQLFLIFLIFSANNIFLGLLALIVDAIYIYLMNQNSKAAAVRFDGIRKSQDKNWDLLFQILNNLKQITSLSLMPSLTSKIVSNNEVFDIQNSKRYKILSTRYCKIPLITQIGKISIYVFLGYLVFNNQLTIDKLVLLVGYYEMVIRNTDSVLEELLNLSNYSIRIKRIDNILKFKSDNQIDYGDLDNDYIDGEVVFDHVTFKLKNKKILDNISFRARPNEITTIVGRPGSGKTTIINLLYRLYAVNSGKILIDNESIYRYSKKVYASNISGVFQNPFVFSASIRENLNIINPNIKEQTKALKRARIYQKITSLKNQFNTKIDLESKVLSDGDLQKLAIARALLTNAEILIFDEVTSHADPETIKDIVEILEDLKQDHTIIIVTHRPEMMKIADQVIVLKEGKIISKGKNKDVLSKSALYRTLRTATFVENSDDEKEFEKSDRSSDIIPLDSISNSMIK